MVIMFETIALNVNKEEEGEENKFVVTLRNHDQSKQNKTKESESDLVR